MISVVLDGGEVTIRVKGRFTYQVYDQFRDAYINRKTGTRYVVDLSETEYMDSSGLGMLLLLGDYAGGRFSTITIISPNRDVRRVLDTANFGDVFSIA